jgi:hypothetical protein
MRFARAKERPERIRADQGRVCQFVVAFISKYSFVQSSIMVFCT